jgi:1,4-dihydroxy-2-naphthoate octaprenyltransferase
VKQNKGALLIVAVILISMILACVIITVVAPDIGVNLGGLIYYYSVELPFKYSPFDNIYCAICLGTMATLIVILVVNRKTERKRPNRTPNKQSTWVGDSGLMYNLLGEECALIEK